MPSPTATAVTTAAAPQEKSTAIFTARRTPAWRSSLSSARTAAARARTGQENPWATWSSSRRIEVISALVEGGAGLPGVGARGAGYHVSCRDCARRRRAAARARLLLNGDTLVTLVYQTAAPARSVRRTVMNTSAASMQH